MIHTHMTLTEYLSYVKHCEKQKVGRRKIVFIPHAKYICSFSLPTPIIPKIVNTILFIISAFCWSIYSSSWYCWNSTIKMAQTPPWRWPSRRGGVVCFKLHFLETAQHLLTPLVTEVHRFLQLTGICMTLPEDKLSQDSDPSAAIHQVTRQVGISLCETLWDTCPHWHSYATSFPMQIPEFSLQFIFTGTIRHYPGSQLLCKVDSSLGYLQ